MKLTKLHIFLIILIALILCSCLGICSSTEGFTNNTSYRSYGSYYDNLNDANISATNWSQGLNATRNNPFYNKNDDFHKKRGGYTYKDDDLNGGKKDNSSSYMISTSSKNKNNNNYNSYNKNNRRDRRNDNMFDSVSTGAVNGSIFSNSNSNSSSNPSPSSNNNNGVSRNQIPKGQEDLYILKSQALTPICPACPPPPKINCDEKCGKSKCPPCPPCARCPEPQFTCEKVPNFKSTGTNQNLPIPWMAKL